jgi:hypothetical protein
LSWLNTFDGAGFEKMPFRYPSHSGGGSFGWRASRQEGPGLPSGGTLRSRPSSLRLISIRGPPRTPSPAPSRRGSTTTSPPSWRATGARREADRQSTPAGSSGPFALYGCGVGVGSSRRLEKATFENVAIRWVVTDQYPPLQPLLPNPPELPPPHGRPLPPGARAPPRRGVGEAPRAPGEAPLRCGLLGDSQIRGAEAKGTSGYFPPDPGRVTESSPSLRGRPTVAESFPSSLDGRFGADGVGQSIDGGRWGWSRRRSGSSSRGAGYGRSFFGGSRRWERSGSSGAWPMT